MTTTQASMRVLEVARSAEENAIARYDKRFKEFGVDARALGWDSSASQRIRFQAATSSLDLAGREVLDIGCGFGDFLAYLNDEEIRPSAYTGIDINPTLLEAAQDRFPAARFERRSIILEPPAAPVADVGVMLGLLNFRLHDISNYEYSQAVIRAAFLAVREALVVDFLSSCRHPGYPAEDFVFYHEPEAMLAFALSLTPDVTLKHDYRPIPQREFLLVLRKPQ